MSGDLNPIESNSLPSDKNEVRSIWSEMSNLKEGSAEVSSKISPLQQLSDTIFVPGPNNDDKTGFMMLKGHLRDILSDVLEPILQSAIKRGLMARILSCDISDNAIANATSFKLKNIENDPLRENLSRLKLPKRHATLQTLSNMTRSLQNVSTTNNITNVLDPSTQLLMAGPVDTRLLQSMEMTRLANSSASAAELLAFAASSASTLRPTSSSSTSSSSSSSAATAAAAGAAALLHPAM